MVSRQTMTTSLRLVVSILATSLLCAVSARPHDHDSSASAEIARPPHDPETSYPIAEGAGTVVGGAVGVAKGAGTVVAEAAGTVKNGTVEAAKTVGGWIGKLVKFF
ncbi:unnamed protein product [Cylicostephanus goldi]|uniref:Transmembrane protein n=1 Tax=Cylicostephanus goldi TaxID=71465 RepID=A0A3P6RZB1_CYLGO|nr:unnamed protein product [Cylicostephanus goldi]